MGVSEYNAQTDSDRDSVLNTQFDTRVFLENLSGILKGFAYDPDTKSYISIRANGFLNAVGAKQVLNEIEARIQNVNASAMLRRQEISSLREDVWFATTKKLFINAELYEMDAENLKPILHILDHNLLTFLSRAEEGGFFKRLSNFFQRKETISQQYMVPEEQKKRFSF